MSWLSLTEIAITMTTGSRYVTLVLWLWVKHLLHSTLHLLEMTVTARDALVIGHILTATQIPPSVSAN